MLESGFVFLTLLGCSSAPVFPNLLRKNPYVWLHTECSSVYDPLIQGITNTFTDAQYFCSVYMGGTGLIVFYFVNCEGESFCWPGLSPVKL